MSFVWPWVFLLLPLPLIFLLWRNHSRFVDTIDLPPSVTRALNEVDQTSRSTLYNGLRWFFLASSWLALITAIAQPYKNDDAIAQQASGRALVLLIDLSTSMERRDFTLNGDAVDRLTVVKDIAGNFIIERQGDRIGLVLFGSEAFIASPLSFDLNAINAILQSSGIGMAGRTTAIGDALGLAIKALRGDPATDKAIVMLSDGTNNAGSAEPEDAAMLAASLGITIHTIGLGSDSSVNESQKFQTAAADLDEETLKSVSEAANGQFFRARTTDELNTIYREIDRLQGGEVLAPPLIAKSDFRNVFIIIALLCLMALTITDIRYVRPE